MQTFLPYSSFPKSAEVLDRQRLGKQRVETLQILNSLNGVGGWRNHPAVRMWAGYENSLVEYGLAVCDEWIRRGYKDTCYGKIAAHMNPDKAVTMPPWMDGPIHASHRSALLAKNPTHYGQFNWGEKPEINYHWPVKKEFA